MEPCRLREGRREAPFTAFVNTAIGWLKEAASRGADTATLTAILKQLVVALNAAS